MSDMNWSPAVKRKMFEKATQKFSRSDLWAIFGAGIITGMLIMLITTWVAKADPLPYPKVGQCAAGYIQSGGYCVPMHGINRPAVPKVGQCPAGWTQSGSACLGPKERR